MRALFLLLALVGCYHTEFSPELREPAVVVDVVFSPRQHGSGVGVGVTGGGNMAVTSVSVTIPEVYAVVFECQHGRFIVERKDLWERLHAGDSVIVWYREEWRVTKKHRTLVDYDFLDATRKP